jgi:O-antigen ligase
MPNVGIHTTGEFAGNWKGVFSQKNEFGAHSTMTLIVLFLLANYAENKQRWMFSLFIFCFAAVVVSGSVTALVLSFVGLSLTLLYRKFTWIGKRSVLWSSSLLTLFSAVTYFLISNWNEIIVSLGKDPTLSGRTLVWGFLIKSRIPSSLGSLLIGHGRGVFWRSPNLFGGIERAANHVPSHAHNGFLDLILDVGLIGLALFIITWAIAYAKAVRLAYNFKQAAFLWPLIFLSMLILFNIFESYLARLANLYWVLFIAIAFSLNRKPLPLD